MFLGHTSVRHLLTHLHKQSDAHIFVSQIFPNSHNLSRAHVLYSCAIDCAQCLIDWLSKAVHAQKHASKLHYSHVFLTSFFFLNPQTMSSCRQRRFRQYVAVIFKLKVSNFYHKLWTVFFVNEMFGRCQQPYVFRKLSIL